jgi:thiamine pyrophosphate-dependent acetolactate synthase large subunit-like protein
MRKTGAKTIVDQLIKHNVKNVFGVSGGAILPVLNEFYQHKKINFIQTRTELGASFMAEGYAKATKTPGIVMVTSGPGAINTMTSLQNAQSDGTPILALTGQVSTLVLGTDAFQEADIISISKPCTKWNYIIKDGSEINSVMNNAFANMLSKRHGPVLLDLPKNIMSNETEQLDSVLSELKPERKATITIAQIFKMILASKKPVILCGQGVLQANAINLFQTFATRTSIPVTTTLMGLGCFPENNIQSLKMLGMHGSYYANMAIQNCDLLINFGSRFDDRIIGDPTKFAPNATIIHIDIDMKNINKVIKTQYYINDNCKTVLEELNHHAYYNLEYKIYHIIQNKINNRFSLRKLYLLDILNNGIR